MAKPGNSVSIRFPLLTLGLRPFYLVAALFAVLALPLWLANYFGLLHIDGYLSGPSWHIHEMVFGFTTAVITGFLLTAVRNWTRQPLPTGGALAALTALWVCARVLALTGPVNVAAVADLAFIPVLAVVIGVPIWRSHNVRNFKLLAVLAGLMAVNVLYHGAQLSLIPGKWAGISVTAALDLITILIAIIGGRVIPAFIGGAVPTAAPRVVTGIEAISHTTLVLILIVGFVQVRYDIPAYVYVSLLGVAATVHTLRWILWKPHCTYRNALLWMLPVAYAWIPVSLAFRALASLQLISPVAAVHALTLGGISSLMAAMMMRSALGHTGRMLKAGAVEISVFVLLQLAAVVRVGGTFAGPDIYRGSVTVSGVLWSLAFAVFLSRYWAVLTQARIDGPPGASGK